MGSAERRALTDDMLAKIDAVVSGHEHQRTTELAMSIDPEPDDDALGAALDQFIDAMDLVITAQQRAVMVAATARAVYVIEVSLPPRFRTLVKQAIRACPPVPVPAKAAHRRRFDRG